MQLMPNLVVSFLPSGTKITVPAGSFLTDAFVSAGFLLASPCGGAGTCGRCRVRIGAGAPAAEPSRHLNADELASGYRLACRTRIETDLTVEVPELAGESLTLELARRPIAARPGEPLARLVELRFTDRELAEAAPDAEKLQRKTSAVTGRSLQLPELPLLKKLTEGLVEKKRVAFLAGGDEELLPFKATVKSSVALGAAIDLGTTAVSVSVVDLAAGEALGTATDYNRQLPFGADIIHRILVAGRPGGAKQLRDAVNATIIHLLSTLAAEIPFDPGDLCAAAVAGNPTMIHLWLGLDPAGIREIPSHPVALTFPILAAHQALLPLPPGAPVCVAPGVANYLGGDIIAGLLATDAISAAQPFLFIDLGTNGEIVLGTREWLVGCACSAGPAFEGMGISCGVRAVPGAIDRFRFTPRGAPEATTLGRKPPVGFCGSGLIDLVAELKRTGMIDPGGQFTPAAQTVTDHFGRLALPLLPRPDGGDVRITQADLANLIRTKGAIFAGIRTLLASVELELDAVDRVYVSGGIGSHLDFDNAVALGLLPDLPRDRYRFLGNSSLAGAERLLVSSGERQLAAALAARTTYLDLSTASSFPDEFTAACFLPHTDALLFPSQPRA